jgi:hypothetical protein
MDQVTRGSSVLLVQGESEKRMHRVLYLIRITRTNIIQLIFLFLAVILYLSTGISVIYDTDFKYLLDAASGYWVLTIAFIIGRIIVILCIILFNICINNQDV